MKIYFGEKPLYLISNLTPEIENLLKHDEVVFINELSKQAIHTIIHELNQSHIKAGVFMHSDLAVLQHELFKKFTIVEAAGGAVVNGDNELLLIFRRGKWDLPKGKVEKGEALNASALREVEEETGIGAVKLIKSLCTTYHTYNESGHHILKPTHWFLMQSHFEGTLTPQFEEDIEEVRWVSLDNVEEYTSNTYPNIKDVIEKLQPELRGFF